MTTLAGTIRFVSLRFPPIMGRDYVCFVKLDTDPTEAQVRHRTGRYTCDHHSTEAACDHIKAARNYERQEA